MPTHPNLIFVFGDQWRAQACGYAGDPNVQTPCIDAFARESVNLPNAVSGYPVCCPYRASLLTGQYPLTHGMIVNDQRIRGNPVSFADALNGAGYETAYIGKWHVHGPQRSAFIRPDDRMGITHWLGYECTHDYNNSYYYADTPERRRWEGYDAEAQTDAACAYLRERAGRTGPFALFLSWGPPHDPYGTAPERFRARYDAERIALRPNVPDALAAAAREKLAGYYAHCSALDACFGTLLAELERAGMAEDTVVVFTSDHGDMLGSHGRWNKQVPQEESIRVPFLLRWPGGVRPREAPALLNAPDVMPTLLGVCGVPVPGTVEGRDFSPAIRGEAEIDDDAYLACFAPFHQYMPANGGRAYRGLRTARYTYARDHAGPWLLYDNMADPYQRTNLADDPDHAALREELDARLQRRLAELHDPFEDADTLLRRYEVRLNEQGDVYYEW